MCIAILKLKDGIITDDALRLSFESNPDGAGIAYTVDNKLIINKGLFNVNDFIKAVKDAELICDNNMLIHCRISTSGLINKDNCHPFYVHDDSCMIHNGILDIKVPNKSKINDTQIFINDYLKEFTTHDILNRAGLKKMIEKILGYNNKFVFLNNKGEYAIMNEEAGEWHDGVWYSNSSHQPKNYLTTYSSKYLNHIQDDKWGDYLNESYYDDINYYNIGNKYGLTYYDCDLTGLDIIELTDLYDAILNQIDGLTNYDLNVLGNYPVIDVKNKKIISENIYLKELDKPRSTNKSYFYLDELPTLYEEYMGKIDVLTTPLAM